MEKYYNNLRESRRLREFFDLDEKLLGQSKPIEFFEEDDPIYRIDYDAYVEEEIFEKILDTKRIRLEYMFVYNSYSPTKALQEIENLSDDELEELVISQLTNEECYVYYTTAKGEKNDKRTISRSKRKL